MNEDTRTYEIACLVSEPERALRVEEFIKKAGGVILSLEAPREISLAYPIEKRDSAFFFYSDFTLDPAAIESLERDLRLAAIALRFLIVTPPPLRYVPRSERRPSVPRQASSPAPEGGPSALPEGEIAGSASNADLQAALTEIER